MRILRHVAVAIWSLIASIIKHDIASLAATIAFYAFFSLFPLILLIVYAASVFLPETQIENVLLDLLRPYFPAVQNSQQLIDINIARLTQAGANVGWLSAITLTWSATSGFIAVQQALDVIWEFQPRSFVARRFIAFLTMCILLLLTMLSAVFMGLYQGFDWQHHLALWRPLGWIHGLSRTIFPVSLLLGLTVSYRFLPSKQPSWTSVVPGAVVAMLLLDKGRELFVWYVGHLIRYDLVYGTLTAVMLLVLWMYLASIVALFGVEVSAAIERILSRDERLSM